MSASSAPIRSLPIRSSGSGGGNDGGSVGDSGDHTRGTAQSPPASRRAAARAAPSGLPPAGRAAASPLVRADPIVPPAGRRRRKGEATVCVRADGGAAANAETPRQLPRPARPRRQPPPLPPRSTPPPPVLLPQTQPPPLPLAPSLTPPPRATSRPAPPPAPDRRRRGGAPIHTCTPRWRLGTRPQGLGPGGGGAGGNWGTGPPGWLAFTERRRLLRMETLAAAVRAPSSSTGGARPAHADT